MCSRVSGTPAASRPDYRSTQGLPLDRSCDHDEFGKNAADSKVIVVVERSWARLGGSWRCPVDFARKLHVDRGQDSRGMPDHAGIAHFLERRQACWMLLYRTMAEWNSNPKSRSRWKGQSDDVGVEDRNVRSMAKRGLLTRARTGGSDQGVCHRPASPSLASLPPDHSGRRSFGGGALPYLAGLLSTASVSPSRLTPHLS